MDGLGNIVGNGITSLVSGAFDVIGGTIRAMFGMAQGALPGGLLFVVAFIVIVAIFWQFAKR
jgi:hypothetical protein